MQYIQQIQEYTIFFYVHISKNIICYSITRLIMQKPLLPKDEWAIILQAQRSRQLAVKENEALHLRMRKLAYKEQLQRQAQQYRRKSMWDKEEDKRYLQHIISSSRKDDEQKQARRQHQFDLRKKMVEDNLKLMQVKRFSRVHKMETERAQTYARQNSDDSRGSEKGSTKKYQAGPKEELVRFYQQQIKAKEQRRRQQLQKEKQTQQIRRQLELQQQKQRNNQLLRIKQYKQDSRVYQMYQKIRQQQINKNMGQQVSYRVKAQAQAKVLKLKQEELEAQRRNRLLSYKQGLQLQIDRKARQKIQSKTEALRSNSTYKNSEQIIKTQRDRRIKEQYIKGLQAQLAEKQQKKVLGKYMTEEQLRMNKGSLTRAAVGYLNEGVQASPLQIGMNRDDRRERLIDRSLGLQNHSQSQLKISSIGGIEQQHIKERLQLFG